MAKLILTINDASARRARARGEQLQLRRHTPSPLTVPQRIILFLRAAGGRASLALPNFYVFLGAHGIDKKTCSYSDEVKASALGFSARTTISICCRSVFDYERGELAPSVLKAANEEHLRECSEYWGRKDPERTTEAYAALTFLRELFRRCARTSNERLKDASLLEARLSTIINHANTESAHISLDYYEFDIFDYAHVVAAMTIIGAVIHAFDRAGRNPERFDQIDRTSYEIARSIFPSLQAPRLFENFLIRDHLKPYWTFPTHLSLGQVLNDLPHATGWWTSQEE